MKIDLGFGNGVQTVNVPDAALMGILVPNDMAHELVDEEEVARALASPIGTPRLRDIVRRGEKIAIVTSDTSRPMPTWRVMPALLDELRAGGCAQEDVSLIFALGCHRSQTQEEMRKLAGERAWAEIACFDSGTAGHVSFGRTSRGTPVDIDRRVAEADRRICLGNIEFHYFAGYSGGAKAIMPGCSTREAIQHDHSMMVRPEACAGRLEGNPVREDIEEAAALVGVDFILNVVLDEHKRIVRAVAGGVTEAHREGCRYLDRMYLKEIGARADIVIASQGGAPKDRDLYQTQKALDNAKHAVRPGGAIVLIGSCKEGLGEATFEEWMLSAPSPASLIERVERDFQLGGHKAAAIAMVLKDAAVYLVSDLEDGFVERLFLTPARSAQAALDAAFGRLGRDAKVLVMPYAGSTLPRVQRRAAQLPALNAINQRPGP